MAPSSSIKVLVCSGNLGNAKPSLNSDWIPQDGSCHEALSNPKYPLQDQPTYTGTPAEKFDLIVIGLQEATFDPNKSNEKAAETTRTEQMADGENIDEWDESTRTPANDEGRDISTQYSSSSSMAISESLHSVAARAVQKSPVGKMSRALSTLTANRNHHTANNTIHSQPKKELLPDGTATLHSQFQQHLPSYQQKVSFQRGEMRLLVYAHCQQELDASTTTNIKSLEVESIGAKNTGKGGLANKGGIFVVLKINQVTRLCFVTCHLEAHEGLDKYERRCESMTEILAAMDVGGANQCFVFGDLNFRTRHDGHIYSQDQRDDVIQLVEAKDWNTLNQADELHLALDQHKCLAGFQTLPCLFPPTFKVDRGPGYVYKDSRTPSYTDRILWRTGPQQASATPLLYEPVDDFVTSDHKPIRAAFDVPLGESFTLAPRHRHPLNVLLRRMPGMHTFEKKKNLHLYLSDIQCDIFPNKRDETPPDTRVALFSNPRQLLHGSRQKWYHCHKKTSLNPCTFVHPKTFNPDWGDHEIHAKLWAHNDDGSPVELGGSLLTLNVARFNNGRKGDNVGSFLVNLEYMYRACIDTSEDKQKVRDFLSNKGNNERESSVTLHDTANVNMLSMDIDGPLWNNGRQTGVIRCSLDAWWVSDSLAHAAKAHALEHGLSTNDTHSRERSAKSNICFRCWNCRKRMR